MTKKTKILIPAVIFSVLLLAIAVPSYIRAHTTKSTNACAVNLRLIQAAKVQWGLENHKPPNTRPAWTDIQPYVERGITGELRRCPDGGVYTIGRLDENPTCSIGGDHFLW